MDEQEITITLKRHPDGKWYAGLAFTEIEEGAKWYAVQYAAYDLLKELNKLREVPECPPPQPLHGDGEGW